MTGMSRPETGPMVFGNDWPGIFIRGDNALMGYVPPLTHAISTIGPDPASVMIVKQLEGLRDLLISCAAPCPEAQKMKAWDEAKQ